MRSYLTPTTLAAVALVAGCGGGDTSQPSKQRSQKAAVVSAVKDYESAFIKGDGQGVCGRLAGDGKVKIITAAAPLGAKSCEGAVAKILDLNGKDDLAKVKRSRDGLSESAVTIHGKRARVRLLSGKTIGLVRSEGEWLISRP